MQRERGKKRDSSKKSKVRAVGKIGRKGAVWSVSGGEGREKGRQTEKAERELSSKQEKAKGKGQESRHQNRFPPLFTARPPHV